MVGGSRFFAVLGCKGGRRVNAVVDRVALVVDEETLLEFTGQREVRDVRGAEERVTKARRAVQLFEQEVGRARWRVAYCGVRAFAGRVGVPAWVAGLAVGSAGAVVLGVPVAMLGVGEGWVGAAVVVGYAIGVGLAVVLGPRVPEGAVGESEAERRQWQWERAKDRLGTARENLRLAGEAVGEAERLREGIARAVGQSLTPLLEADWGGMTGEEFETFLGKVFRRRGYRVTPTGRTGDQGVDLIVELGGERVAVQAKCYGGSVGNAAVQEVFAGMAHYRCQRCAVVTNSQFTASARELAESTGCRLVEGRQLRELIRGKIRV